MKKVEWSRLPAGPLLAAAAAVLFGTVFAACGSVPAASRAPPAAGGGLALDQAIAQAAAHLEARLPAGTEAAIVNISSPRAAFSAYVLDGLEAALVNGGKLVVADRANLDKVRAELGFQASGEVSDESAASIGQMVGAGAIITGSLTELGAWYRLSVKAINVEKATVAASFLADLAADERVRALLAGGGRTAHIPAPAPERAFAAGVLGGVWAGTVAYTAGGRSFRDAYRISLFAGGVCRVSVEAAGGAAQTAEGHWADEGGTFRLDCEFGSPAIARLGSVHWLSLYAFQSDQRALRVNVRPAPDYSGVVAVTFYKE
ncbi:MAG: penicillin-binding protein activator LpoB [Treponema sp.]|jgi:hypothetical protein|nr:penicillin-binding protein activator LpoB [Treponema sp.]